MKSLDSRSERLLDGLHLQEAGSAEMTDTKNLPPELNQIDFVSVPPGAVDKLARCQHRLESYVEGFLEVQATRQQCQNLVEHLKQLGRELQDEFWDEVDRLLGETEPLTILSDLVLEEQQALVDAFGQSLEEAQAQLERGLRLDTRGPAAKKVRDIARSMDSTAKDLRRQCEREARDSLKELNACVTWILTSKVRPLDGGRTEDSGGGAEKLLTPSTVGVQPEQTTRGLEQLVSPASQASVVGEKGETK